MKEKKSGSNVQVGRSSVHRIKIQLISEIEKIIRHSNLTQAKMAEILGINQPKVSRLMKYNLNDFSVVRLMHFLNVLGQNIDISINSKSSKEKYGITNIKLLD